MRAILVGPTDARRRMRAELDAHGIETIGEFDTLLDAQASDLDADVVISTLVQARRLETDETGIIEEPLTPREIQVLEALAEGLPNKAIAERLGISDQTVKFHVSAIMGKLGTGNRVETVRRAVRRGLIAL